MGDRSRIRLWGRGKAVAGRYRIQDQVCIHTAVQQRQPSLAGAAGGVDPKVAKPAKSDSAAKSKGKGKGKAKRRCGPMPARQLSVWHAFLDVDVQLHAYSQRGTYYMVIRGTAK